MVLVPLRLFSLKPAAGIFVVPFRVFKPKKNMAEKR